MLDESELKGICDIHWGKDQIDAGGGYKPYIEHLCSLNSSGIFRHSKIVDECRRLGVLVGFRHFTPEMLIAEGVVKLKTL